MTLLLIYCAVVGVVIGSFLNVVIYRVPRHLSIVRPRSSCPNCHHPIAGRDNVPIVSWILLGRRCRQCRTPISLRYPLVEGTTGALFALVAWRIGAHVDLVAYLVLSAALVALALIDAEHLLLPRAIVYPTLMAVAGWLILCAAYYDQWRRLGVAVGCAMGWFVLFYALNFFSPKSLGFGDVRLAPVLGLSLGWLGLGEVFVGFFLSNLVGAIVGVLLIATKKRTREQPIPYGVYLALGTIITVLIGPALLAHWHHWPSA